MSLKIKINGVTYRIVFRLAVVCEAFLEPRPEWDTHPRTMTLGIQNPKDKFNLFIGAREAFKKMLKALYAPEADRVYAWGTFLNKFRPWMKMTPKQLVDDIVAASIAGAKRAAQRID